MARGLFWSILVLVAMEYSAKHNMLFVRNSGSQVRVIDVANDQIISTRTPIDRFTDLSVTPSGDYLFVADFGDENVYGEPISPNHVHRFDIANRTWTSLEVQGTGIAYRIEAVGPERVLLLSSDQWVTLSYNSYEPSLNRMFELSKRDWLLYFGDIEYDPVSGRVYHGNSGSSSNEITVFELRNEALTTVESTDVYGTAQGHGPGAVLSSDAQLFFYGRLQVEAADVTANQRVHPEAIVAASAELAFDEEGAAWGVADGGYYGRAAVTPTAIHMSRTSDDLWLALPDNATIAHCEVQGTTVGCPGIHLCNGLQATFVMGVHSGTPGTAGNDVIVGTAGADVIDGLGGDDVICGAGGDDTIDGGDGHDLILGGNGNDWIVGGPGDDRIRGQNGNDRIDGGPGQDNLNGNNGNDNVNGQDGDDYVSGRDGYDLVTGGPGNDIVYGGGKTDELRGGPGHDEMWGNAFKDNMWGGRGNDAMSGGDGPDHLRGEMGDDLLDGNRGNDILWGGNGHDECNGRTGWDSQINCELTVDIP